MASSSSDSRGSSGGGVECVVCMCVGVVLISVVNTLFLAMFKKHHQGGIKSWIVQ